MEKWVCHPTTLSLSLLSPRLASSLSFPFLVGGGGWAEWKGFLLYTREPGTICINNALKRVKLGQVEIRAE